MAEALGLVASIIAVVELASSTLKFVKKTQRFTYDLSTIERQIHRSLNNIKLHAKSIHCVSNTLEKCCEKHIAGTEHSEVIGHIEDEHRLTESLGIESRFLQRDINELQQQLWSSLRPSRWEAARLLWTTWKWNNFLKAQVEGVRLHLNYLQCNLILILNTILLENAMKRREKDPVLM